MVWWGTREKPSARMAVEIAAMKKVFHVGKLVRIPSHVGWDSTFFLQTHDLKLVTTDVQGPYWLVSFSMRPENASASIQSSDTYRIKILYQAGYPNKEPVVTLESHDVSDSPHKFQGGYLCLHNHSSTRAGWDPSKSTAATFGLWSVEWVRAWLYWRRTDDWPENG